MTGQELLDKLSALSKEQLAGKIILDDGGEYRMLDSRFVICPPDKELLADCDGDPDDPKELGFFDFHRPGRDDDAYVTVGGPFLFFSQDKDLDLDWD